MKNLYEHIPKEIISQMPRTLFDGRIWVIQTADEMDKAIRYLSTFPLLGLDTETRPSFRKGIKYKVSLLQVSTEDTCFLFRLHLLEQTDPIARLLSDEHILKIGLSLHDDLNALAQRGVTGVKNYLDIQDHVRQVGIKDMSLQKIYANIFEQRISKTQRLSNWEADVLSEAQKRYAATDAWACLKLYQEINNLVTSKDYHTIPTTVIPNITSDEP